MGADAFTFAHRLGVQHWHSPEASSNWGVAETRRSDSMDSGPSDLRLRADEIIAEIVSGIQSKCDSPLTSKITVPAAVEVAEECDTSGN